MVCVSLRFDLKIITIIKFNKTGENAKYFNCMGKSAILPHEFTPWNWHYVDDQTTFYNQTSNLNPVSSFGCNRVDCSRLNLHFKCECNSHLPIIMTRNCSGKFVFTLQCPLCRNFWMPYCFMSAPARWGPQPGALSYRIYLWKCSVVCSFVALELSLFSKINFPLYKPWIPHCDTQPPCLHTGYSDPQDPQVLTFKIW